MQVEMIKKIQDQYTDAKYPAEARKILMEYLREYSEENDLKFPRAVSTDESGSLAICLAWIGPEGWVEAVLNGEKFRKSDDGAINISESKFVSVEKESETFISFWKAF